MKFYICAVSHNLEQYDQILKKFNFKYNEGETNGEIVLNSLEELRDFSLEMKAHDIQGLIFDGSFSIQIYDGYIE